jgi:hypothetical protein
MERPEFAEYVAGRSARLQQMAYLLTRDRGKAEDLVQTALAKAWLAWRRIDGDPDPYVYRVIVNTHAGWWRRRWRAEVPTARLPERADITDADLVNGLADRTALWAAVCRLSRFGKFGAPKGAFPLVHAERHTALGKGVRIVYRPKSGYSMDLIRCTDPKAWVVVRHERAGGAKIDRCDGHPGLGGSVSQSGKGSTTPDWTKRPQAMTVWVFPPETASGFEGVEGVLRGDKPPVIKAGTRPIAWAVGIYDRKIAGTR